MNATRNDFSSHLMAAFYIPLPFNDMLLLKWRMEMTKNIYVVLFVLIMITIIVSMDLLFFKNRFWERLMANIGIVLVFIAFYLRFLKKL